MLNVVLDGVLIELLYVSAWPLGRARQTNVAAERQVHGSRFHALSHGHASASSSILRA